MSTQLNDDFFVHALAEHAEDVILVTEAEHLDAPDGPKIVYCNRAFELFTGYTRAEVMGDTPRILQVDEGDRVERDKIRAAMKAWNDGNENARARVTLRNKKKEGGLFWVELNLVPVWAPDYSRSYWAAIQRDVTEQVEREQFIRELLAKEAEARQSQSLFLANMSHELRTPLNAMIGNADALQSGLFGSMTERQLESLEGIHSSGRHMLSLVEDLLDADEIVRGKTRLTMSGFELGEALQFAISTVSLVDYKNNSPINTSGVRHQKRKIFADITRVRQCLINIIGNACKFSPQGATVTLQTFEDDNFISVSVTDQGPGMSAQQQTEAFAMFGQVSRDATVAQAGVGLGIPITARLMDMLGGKMIFSTELGKGTTVTLAFKKDCR